MSRKRKSGSLILPQSWRIQLGLLNGIAVCSTKTASEEKRLVYLAPNSGVGDRFFSFYRVSSKPDGLMDEEHGSKRLPTMLDTFM